MLSLYSRRIFPWVLNTLMQDRAFQSLRAPTLANADGKILEIGFGSGMNMSEYPKTVREITAIDPSPELFLMAKERIRESGIQVQFVSGSAEDLPFANDEFATVVSTWSLCSIPDVRKALDEVFRVLKPGGAFLYIEHGLSPTPRWQLLQKRLTPIWKHIGGGCHLDRQIEELVAQAGFTLKKHTSFPLERGRMKLLHLYQGVAIKPSIR